MQRVELKVVPLKQVENYSIYNSFEKIETLQSLPLPTFGSALCSVAFGPGGPGGPRKKAFFGVRLEIKEVVGSLSQSCA